MNKTTREIIKEEIEKLKRNKNKKYYFCISLTFDAITFNEYFKDYKNFWHLLTKSFLGPINMTSNNKWYNNLEPEGFYFFTESYNLVQYRIYLETNKKIKYEELIKRVNDIVPIKELELYHNNEYEFNKMFANDIFVIQKSKIEYLGSLFDLGDGDNQITI
jgi:hypothetical protein